MMMVMMMMMMMMMMIVLLNTLITLHNDLLANVSKLVVLRWQNTRRVNLTLCSAKRSRSKIL